MVIFTPKTGAIFAFNGRTTRWIAGQTLIEEGAEILKGREHLVRPVTIHYPAGKQHDAAPKKAKATKDEATETTEAPAEEQGQ